MLVAELVIAVVAVVLFIGVVVAAAADVVRTVVVGVVLVVFAFVVLVGVSLIAGSVTICFFVGDFSVVAAATEELFGGVFCSTGVSVTEN